MRWRGFTARQAIRLRKPPSWTVFTKPCELPHGLSLPGDKQPESKRRKGAGPSRLPCDSTRLEPELGPELESPGWAGAGDFPKIHTSHARIDPAQIDAVESVERVHTHQQASNLVTCEPWRVEGLRHGHVHIGVTRIGVRVSPQVAVASQTRSRKLGSRERANVDEIIHGHVELAGRERRRIGPVACISVGVVIAA